MKKRENMVSLKTYGRDITEFMLLEEIILSYWKKWVEEIIHEERPMVGFSRATMYEKSLENSSSLFISVCILFPEI